MCVVWGGYLYSMCGVLCVVCSTEGGSVVCAWCMYVMCVVWCVCIKEAAFVPDLASRILCKSSHLFLRANHYSNLQTEKMMLTRLNNLPKIKH